MVRSAKLLTAFRNRLGSVDHRNGNLGESVEAARLVPRSLERGGEAEAGLG